MKWCSTAQIESKPEALCAVGERHLGAPHVVIGAAVEILEEVPLTDVHHQLPPERSCTTMFKDQRGQQLCRFPSL